MLVIRLTRRGRRNDPSFRLVVTEHTNPVRGKFLEELGHLNPVTKIKSFKKERILYWISQGAKCSGTVNNLLINEGIIQGSKIKVWRAKKKDIEEGKEEKKTPESAAEPEKNKKKEEKSEEEIKDKKEPEKTEEKAEQESQNETEAK